MSTEKLNEQISERLQGLDSEQLRVMWSENNRAEWSDQAFAAIEVILSERGVELPSQQDPQYHYDQPDGSIAHSKSMAMLIGGWIMLGAFLIWVLILAPVSEVGYLTTPLTMSEIFVLNIWPGIYDTDTFQTLIMGMIDIKFLITCFGMLAGVLLLIENRRAVVWAKMYLVFVTIWVVLFMSLLNVFPFAEIYWQDVTSVMGLKTDWESLFRGYAVKPGWDLLAFTAKKFWPVLAFALAWFLFFQRSTWIKERFSARVSGTDSNETA